MWYSRKTELMQIYLRSLPGSVRLDVDILQSHTQGRMSVIEKARSLIFARQPPIATAVAIGGWRAVSKLMFYTAWTCRAHAPCEDERMFFFCRT